MFSRIVAPFTLMLKTILGAPSPINIRYFKKAGNAEINDGNEVGNREKERNLSKINSSRTRFLTSEAKIVFTR